MSAVVEEVRNGIVGECVVVAVVEEKAQAAVTAAE